MSKRRPGEVDMADQLYLEDGPCSQAVFVSGVMLKYLMHNLSDPQGSGVSMECRITRVELTEGDLIVFTALAWCNTDVERAVRIDHNLDTGEAEITEYLS